MNIRKFYCKAAMALTFALCLGVTACGAKQETESQVSQSSQTSRAAQTPQTSQTAPETDEPQITMEQIIAANRTENLLSRYHSVCEVVSEVSNNMTRYVESGFRYYIDEGKEEIQMPDTVYGLYDGQYWGQLMPGGKWNFDSDYYAYMGTNPTATALEKITKIEDNGDTLKVYTVLPADSISAAKDTLDYDYQDGDFVECVYSLDSETLAILQAENVRQHADGTEAGTSSLAITYDAPRPEGAVALLERLSDTQNLRTITLINNPGTAEESTDSVSVPKGESAMINSLSDEKFDMFKDSACTEIYTGGADRNEDLTLYVRLK